MTSEEVAEPVDTANESPEADPEDVARTILLDQLSRRPRSRWELGEKLRSRNVADDIAAQLLRRFEEVGLINDREFARMWVDSRARSKKLARAMLRQELRHKHVADEIVDEVLDEVDPDIEAERAREVIRAKLRRQSVPGDPAQQHKLVRRLVGRLARKGYPQSMAFALVREEVAAAASEVGQDDGYDDVEW